MALQPSVSAILNRRPALSLDADTIEAQEAYERQNAVFLALVRLTGNPEHALTFETLAERLEPVQRLAPLALDSVEQETDDILAALMANDARGLRRALVSYHRRRMQVAPQLIERLYSATECRARRSSGLTVTS